MQPAHTILIVEGAASAAVLNTSFLQQPNIRLTRSGDADGMDLVYRERPDLIIETLCDNGDDDALRFAQQLKADPNTQTIPWVLVAPPELRRPAHLEPDALIRTPVVPNEFFEVVRQFVPLPKRRARRYAINLRFAFGHDGRWYQAFSRNLSVNGAFLKTDRLLEPGTAIDLRFTLPGGQSETCCTAIVRQAQDAPESGGLGIEFSGISDEELERLEHFIRRNRGWSWPLSRF